MFEYAHSCSEACVCMCVCYSASKPVSQLSGVLGNALGQRVQPSVAASHHAVWARADVRTTRRRKATIILSTWREGSRESRILAWGGGGGGEDRWIHRGAEKKQQREKREEKNSFWKKVRREKELRGKGTDRDAAWTISKTLAQINSSLLEVLRPDIAKSFMDVFQHMAQHMQLGHRDFKNPQMIQETDKPKKTQNWADVSVFERMTGSCSNKMKAEASVVSFSSNLHVNILQLKCYIFISAKSHGLNF